jgi:NADH-quinone oxidoreductase subunit G
VRAERPRINFLVDGLEVPAEDGTMLVDAAKHGDVEIPVFCYEPKLGQPVGACRMCLVEIEGIPKLQTACSTPVRDGMVVYTRTDRVQEAQEAIVEFLLVNHPLDCPVCDKGGECPLQDIAMGWGPGKSRSIDPKRHFQKPIPLSPLIRIDRERCILCYRCVRFSQEIAEDEQLQLLERGASTLVGTFDDRPYIAPFHGNIIELCPVGALTSEAYRFRARPWDIEDAGSVCTLCPSQCNVILTVRDERVERVLARDHSEVDDGWLCDKGRFGYQMAESEQRITQPLIREGGELRPASWGQALQAAAAGLRQAGEQTAAIVGGSSSNEEGYLTQRILRRGLGSPHVDSRARGSIDRSLAIEFARPELAARVADLDSAESILVIGCDPLHAMPILDLRIRKAVRRHGARLAVATERPSALDGGAEEVARYAPGFASGFVSALAAEVGVEGYERGPGELGADAERIAGVLRPDTTVIVWGGQGDRALVDVARQLGAKLLEVPGGANGRGLGEVGCVPDAGPGLSEVPAGRDAAAVRDGLADGGLKAAFLLNADPVRDLPGGPAWRDALGKAKVVVAVSMFENASTKHADVVLPAESYAEKEGTVTHPDGRLQRLRPGVPHPDHTRPMWEVLVELSALLGDETGIDSAPEALEAIASEVPFYAGITHEEIGGRGVRWQDRDAASEFPQTQGPAPPSPEATEQSVPTQVSAQSAEAGGGEGGAGIRLGTYRDLWAAEATDHSPALRFLAPKQTLELAPADADRLGVAQGEEVDVRSNGTNLRARVAIRERIRPGAGFLMEGTVEANANALKPGELVEVTKSGGDA